MTSLKGKTVLITGGTGGIGWASSKAFAKAGAKVVVSDIKPPIEPDEGLVFVEADATDEDEVKRVVEEAVDRFGKIDVLINNCGAGANLDHELGRPVVFRTGLDMSKADFDQLVEINFWSAVFFVRHTISHMPNSDRSCIISASSIWSRGRLHSALPYAASKAALSLAARNWAYQFAPIRSVSVALGAIDTPMFRANPEGGKKVSEGTLLRRVGTPEEAAATFVYIAGCNYLTATEIFLDGGSFNR